MLNSLCSACILLNPKVAAQSCLVCFRLNKVVPLLALQGCGGDAVALRLRKTLFIMTDHCLAIRLSHGHLLFYLRRNTVPPLLALQGYGGDAVALRLRKTLVRIANQSLVQFKPAIIASRPAHVPTGQSVMLSAL